MNNHDDQLKSSIRGLVVPPADTSRKEAALRLSLSALDARKPPLEFGFSHQVVLKFAAAFMIVAVVPAFIFFHGNKVKPVHNQAAAQSELSLETWKEIGLLFPDQIDAIIAKGSQMDLRLSQSQSAGNTDQVVRITCRNDRDFCTIITYSGRDVNLDFDGLPLRITPLIDGNGSVIVLTQDRVVSPNGSPSTDSVRISATTLAKL